MTTVGTGAATAPSSRALGAAGAAGEPSAASVELVSVVRRFAGEGAPRGRPPARPAVDGVSLAVAPGELFVLLGPSGCGKSTTLRLVAGLEDADAGEVRIGGRSVTHVPPEARDVAMVFQGFALYPRMTVRENLAFPLRMRGASRVDRNAAVDAAARLLRLEPLLDRTPEALSGGERQRVAMGRAIVRRPSVFLFDEPLSNLDAALRTELRVEVGALVRRLGTTSLYVTHDQVEAMTLADRIAVLRAGKVEQVGTPEEVYARPATSFVASFLGSPPMSLVPGRVVGDDVVAGPLRIARGRAEPISEAVEIGLRAEDVTAVPATDGAFVVAFREPYGAETVLGLEAAAPDGGATARLVAKAPGFAALARGARVNVTFDPARAHLFDPARGGARLAR